MGQFTQLNAWLTTAMVFASMSATWNKKAKERWKFKLQVWSKIASEIEFSSYEPLVYQPKQGAKKIIFNSLPFGQVEASIY